MKRRDRIAGLSEWVLGRGAFYVFPQEAIAWLLSDIARLEKALEAAYLTGRITKPEKVKAHNAAIDLALEGDE